MEKAGIHFMFLCFILTALLSLVTAEHKLYNSRSRSKYAGVRYAKSADVRNIDSEYLLENKCKFFIAEKTIFYACPKRPTRYPAFKSEIFRDDDGNDDREEVYGHSEKFECPFPFGTYPHPKDCRKYYLCIFDKPRIMTCDSSKLYDEYEGECAEKSTVDCGDRTGDVTTEGTTQAPGQKTTSAVKTTTKKVQKFKCPYTWGTFPNPDDCSQYYLCLNKRHTLKKCKPKELYDTRKNECRDENKVDCGSRYNPREKTTKLPVTTTATTVRPTTSVTTTKEEISSAISEQPTSPSGDTSDQGLTEEVSPSSETKTTTADETEGTPEKITSEDPAQSTEQPAITDDDSSETNKPEPSSEEPKITDDDSSKTDMPEPTSEEPKITDQNTSDSDESESTSVKPEITDNNVSDEPEITDENTSGTGEVEPSTEQPIITDGVTSDTEEPESTSKSSEPTDDGSSESDEPEPISENPQNTNNDIVDTDEPELTSEGSSDTEDKLTEGPQSTENDITPDTEENGTPSEESEAPVEKTTPSSELRSSLPEDNTKSSKEISTGGEVETEEENTSPQPESTVNDVSSPEELHSPTEGKIHSTPSTDSDNTDEEAETSSQPETTAEENITPEVSQATIDGKGISSGDEVETSPATSSERPEVFVCPKKKGNFLHKDCSLYYACRGGNYTIKSCPHGTLFHSVYGMCDNEDNVDCGDRKRRDKDEQSTLADTSSSASPTARPITETVADIDTSSEISKSFENTDKTVDYTSIVVSETTSILYHTTEKTGSTYDFDNNDLTSTGNTEDFETSGSKTKGLVGTESTTDYETSETFTGDEVVETSESQSTSIFSTQEISDSTKGKTSAVSSENYSTGEPSQISSTVDYATKESISSTHRESIETSLDKSTEKSSSIYSTEPTSKTTATHNTEDTSYVGTWDEISVETRTDFVRDETSTQNIADDKEQQSTSEATEETGDRSTGDQSTSFTSETTHSDSQDETTVDYTDVSITGTDIASQTHNTGNIDETTSSSFGDDEISTKNITIFRTDEPSTQSSTDDEGTSDQISTVGTTAEVVNKLTSSDDGETSDRTSTVGTSAEEVVNELTSSDDEATSDRINTVGTTAEEVVNELTSSGEAISTKQESTTFMPETTEPNSDGPLVSETTEAGSYLSSETIQGNFSSSTEVTSTTKVPDTTSRSPEEIPSTEQQKELCLATDKKCIADKNGNVFRCPKSHGHFPHPWDKSKFLHCDSFRIHVINCPSGLHFDPIHSICTWAAAGKE